MRWRSNPMSAFNHPIGVKRVFHDVRRSDKMDDRINDAFAGIFSSSLRRRPIDKALLDTADKYPRLVNVLNLAVPQINDVIRERMRKGPQIVDAHLQKVMGDFHKKTALPRYNVTWYVSILLAYLRSLSPVMKFSLKYLSLKLLCYVLCCLASQHTYSMSGIWSWLSPE